jgi:hypothetical protein
VGRNDSKDFTRESARETTRDPVRDSTRDRDRHREERRSTRGEKDRDKHRDDLTRKSSRRDKESRVEEGAGDRNADSAERVQRFHFMHNEYSFNSYMFMNSDTTRSPKRGRILKTSSASATSGSSRDGIQRTPSEVREPD